MLLNSFKWYRRLRGGTWEYIWHTGINCEAWFRNRTFTLTSSERVEQTENYE